jgi:hypothetical protein
MENYEQFCNMWIMLNDTAETILGKNEAFMGKGVLIGAKNIQASEEKGTQSEIEIHQPFPNKRDIHRIH